MTERVTEVADNSALSLKMYDIGAVKTRLSAKESWQEPQRKVPSSNVVPITLKDSAWRQNYRTGETSRHECLLAQLMT